MANPYRVFVRSISTDGVNYYFELEIFYGVHSFPFVRPAFDVSVPATTIASYIQAIADSQPAIPGDIGALVGTMFIGV